MYENVDFTSAIMSKMCINILILYCEIFAKTESGACKPAIAMIMLLQNYHEIFFSLITSLLIIF